MKYSEKIFRVSRTSRNAAKFSTRQVKATSTPSPGRRAGSPASSVASASAKSFARWGLMVSADVRASSSFPSGAHADAALQYAIRAGEGAASVGTSPEELFSAEPELSPPSASPPSPPRVFSPRSFLSSALLNTSRNFGPKSLSAAFFSLSSRPCSAMNASRRAGSNRAARSDPDPSSASVFERASPSLRKSARGAVRVVSFSTSTSAVNTTTSSTTNPPSASKSVVRVTNSRHPQSFAARPYRF